MARSNMSQIVLYLGSQKMQSSTGSVDVSNLMIHDTVDCAFILQISPQKFNAGHINLLTFA